MRKVLTFVKNKHIHIGINFIINFLNYYRYEDY